MVKIRAIRNGPYMIEADTTLHHEDKPLGNVIHLCRCGHSNNKPFCDGTHAKINFKAEETTITTHPKT